MATVKTVSESPALTLNAQVAYPNERGKNRKGDMISVGVRYRATSEGWVREENEDNTGWIRVGMPVPVPDGDRAIAVNIFSNVAPTDETHDELLKETARKIMQAIPACAHLTLGMPNATAGLNPNRHIACTSQLKATALHAFLDARIAALAPAK